MNKRALIHIGSGKTGTSSIQDALLEREKNKENKSFRYPVIGSNGHQSIEILFKDYTRITRGLKSRFLKDSDDYKAFVKKYSNGLDKYADSGNVLISSEFLFNFNRLEVERFKGYLEKKGFNEFKVLVYLRNPSDYYLSLVQQKVKAAYKIPSPFDFKTNYCDSVDTWREFFGESVCVREFDREKMVGSDVLQDFSVIASDFFNEYISLKGKPSNETVSAESMVILQDFRRFFYSDQEDCFVQESNLLLKRIKEIECNYVGSKPKLKDRYLKAILENSFDDISKLKKYNIFDDIFSNPGFSHVESFCSADVFSGSVYELIESFDESHYKYILHRLIYESLK